VNTTVLNIKVFAAFATKLSVANILPLVHPVKQRFVQTMPILVPPPAYFCVRITPKSAAFAGNGTAII
jgi:hypothetical protein